MKKILPCQASGPGILTLGKPAVIRHHIFGLFKFFIGILLIQVATGLQVMAALDSGKPQVWLLFGLLSLTLGVMAALWFVSISSHTSQDSLVRAKEDFSRERERIRVQAEQEKAKVLKQSQQQMLRERDRTHAKANMKVGASLAGVVGIGGLMLFTQFMTLGLLTITAAGGALAGYAVRMRQDIASRDRQLALTSGTGSRRQITRVTPDPGTINSLTRGVAGLLKKNV